MTSQDALKAPGQVLEAGKNATGVLVNQGTLGALVILLTIAVGILIWLLYKSKNAHIADKDQMIKVLNENAMETRGLLKDVKNAVDNLSKDVNNVNSYVRDIRQAIGSMDRNLIEAVHGHKDLKTILDTILRKLEVWEYSQKRGG